MSKNTGGIIFDSVIPGDFYFSTHPGGWTDRTTGIHVPGPVVNVDKDTRMYESVEAMPNPVQLPHYKIVVDMKDKDRKIQERKEVPFDRADEVPLHDGLNMALSTGIISHISDEEMQETYPEAWAARKTHYIYDDETKIQRPMGDMIAEFHKKRALEDANIIAEAANRTAPPPPPPPLRTSAPAGKK